jgi:succinate dehydrogenase/fumarate reductase flavoprotein subunit
MDKVALERLLTQGERVVGAVGFGLLDGRYHIVRAKAVILANGGVNYHLRKMWSSGTGDGVAAAYWAGAEMRNAEFSNSTPDIVTVHDSPADCRWLFNAVGDNISQKYMPTPQPDTPMSLLLGIVREVREGRGPVHCDISGRDPADFSMFGPVLRWQRPKSAAFWVKTFEKDISIGVMPFDPNAEVTIRIHCELSPVRVDHAMATTLPGLFAIGDTCQCGSAWTGAYPPPAMKRGSGLLSAALSGARGGTSAVRFAQERELLAVDVDQAAAFKQEIFAPLQRGDGGAKPADVVEGLQAAVAPVKYALVRTQHGMEEALSMVNSVI